MSAKQSPNEFPDKEQPNKPTKHGQPNNPLHGITLKTILEDLVKRRGWEDLATQIHIRCFTFDPSISSSLRFLRKTQWARDKVEALYLNDHR